MLSGTLAMSQQVHDTSVVTGELTRTQLSSESEWFNRYYNKYTPDDSVINAIRSHANDIRFIVVLGTWCSDSREHVPELYKVTDLAGISDSCIRLIGVTRKKDRVRTKELRRLKLDLVPLIVVYRGNKEIGRIIEDTHLNMESDLLSILVK